MKFKKDLVSVIIPVYNVEKYIDKCMISIVNQTYKDLEIIVVNDGTKDDSMKIVDKYKDDRFIIINQENKGLSAARNAGLDIATGEYVKFIDSDDYISRTWIEESVNEIKKDTSLSGVINSNVIHRTENSDRINNVVNMLVDNNVERLPNVWGIWTCLYKREIIENNNIRFFEGLTIEDEGFQICMLPFINKVKIFYGKSIHYYIQRDNSIMASYRNNVLAEDYITILENCAYFYKEKGISLDKIKWHSLFIFLRNQTNIKEYLLKSKEMLKKFDIDINNYLNKSIKSKYYDLLDLDEKYPLVSIIIPSFNGEKYLPNLFKVLDIQTYKNFEIIFVDDGSTDNTKKFIDNLNTDMNIRYFYKENGGVSSARNYGIEQISGDYTYFMDVDDQISENFIQILVEALMDNDDVDLAYCSNINIATPMGIMRSGIYKENSSNKIDPKKIYFVSPIGLGSSIIRSNIILNSGIKYDESININEDMLFFNLLLPNINKMIFVNNCAFLYNKTEMKKMDKKDFINNLENIKSKIETFYKENGIEGIDIYKKVIDKIINK